MMHFGGRSLVTRPLCVALLLSLVLMGAVASTAAQEQYVLLDGRVQWIAGEKMVLGPHSGGPAVNIDLSQVPLHQYTTLKVGSRVVVNGVVADNGQRVIARSVGPTIG